MRNTFNKAEKLKKKKYIDLLFRSGRSISEYPIRLVYLELDHDSETPVQAGVSVSKRNFKKAVERNRIKRLLREVYRTNKHIVYESVHTKKYLFMFIYVGKKEEDYKMLDKKMKKLLKKFVQSH